MSSDCEPEPEYEVSEAGQDDYNTKKALEVQKTQFILIIVISVLSTIVIMLFMFFLYLKCKRKARNSESPESYIQDQSNVRRPCCVHAREFCEHERHSDHHHNINNFQPRFLSRLPPPYLSNSSNGREPLQRPENPVNHGVNEETSRLRYYSTELENSSTGRSPNVEHNELNGAFELLSRHGSLDNPVFGLQDETNSICSDLQDYTNAGPLKELFEITERSTTKTVCGKHLVSIARDVDHNGDILYLDNMGISLKVPAGAVKRGETKRIVLVLNWDLSDNPTMGKTESLVSPVVYVGPKNLKLEKPCTLIFRHCSFDPRQIRVMRSKTDFIEQKSWEPICDRNDESRCYLTSDECQLTIDMFTLYTCVQAPLDNQIGKKWLQIAVFACPLRKERDHHQIRVYFLNKTNCALQWAIQNEAKFGGKLVCPEKVFLFDGNERDMFTLTKYISPGWELLENEEKDRIAFLKIWHGACPHISVCYKRSFVCEQESSSEKSVSIEMNLRLLTYQDELREAAEKIFIQVFEDNITPENENEPKCCRTHLDDVHIHIHNNFGPRGSDAGVNQAEHTVPKTPCNAVAENPNDKSVTVVVNNTPTFTVTSGAEESICDLEQHATKPVLSYDVRKKLIMLLDPSRSPIGADWRDFASALEKDEMICYLQATASPTAQLLDVVEARKMTLTDLVEIFHKIERKDCAKVIQKYMKSDSKSLGGSRTASEHSSEGNEECQERMHVQGRSNLEEESSWTESSSFSGNCYNYPSTSMSSHNSYGKTKQSNVCNHDTIYKPNILSQ